MLIPNNVPPSKRSKFIRLAHRVRRRHCLQQLSELMGEGWRKKVQPLPMRSAAYPTYQEMQEYW